jgi:hypothetical protein
MLLVLFSSLPPVAHCVKPKASTRWTARPLPRPQAKIAPPARSVTATAAPKTDDSVAICLLVVGLEDHWAAEGPTVTASSREPASRETTGTRRGTCRHMGGDPELA